MLSQKPTIGYRRSNEYEISWILPNHGSESVPNARKVVIEITERQVARQYFIACHVKSNKKWHRMYSEVDDSFTYFIRVLPPL